MSDLEIETLHNPFIKFLRDQGLPYIYANPRKKSTIGKGIQDFTIIEGNRVLCVEFKTKGGVLSPDQQKWRDQCAATGTIVHVCRSIDSACELVQAWRFTPSGLPRGEKLVRISNALWRDKGNGQMEKVKSL